MISDFSLSIIKGSRLQCHIRLPRCVEKVLMYENLMHYKEYR